MINDVTSIARGGVYELIDTNGNVHSHYYIVVSSNEYNTLTGQCIICMIGEPETSELANLCFVPFTMTNKGISTNLVVMTNIVFNVKTKRLGKYKFTLKDDIMREVGRKLSNLFMGETVYSLDEAIVELHNKEVRQRIEYEASMKYPMPDNTIHGILKSDVPDVDVSYANLNLEDSQKMFAKTIDDYEVYVPSSNENEEVTTSIPKVKKVTKTTKHKQKTAKGRTKKRKSNRGGLMLPLADYSYLYEHYEDFLDDYYTLSHEEVATLWDIPEKVLRNKVSKCKQLYLSNKGTHYANEKKVK